MKEKLSKERMISEIKKEVDKMIKNAYDEIIKYTENKPVVREISINALNKIESETDMPLIMKKDLIEMQKEFARRTSDR